MGTEGDEARALLRSIQAAVAAAPAATVRKTAHRTTTTTTAATTTAAAAAATPMAAGASAMDISGISRSSCSTTRSRRDPHHSQQQAEVGTGNSGFGRSSSRRQSSAFSPLTGAVSQADHSTPPRRTQLDDNREGSEMTPSQSLRMDYTALSLSPTSADHPRYHQ